MSSSVHNSLPSRIQAVAIVDPSSGGHFVAERLEMLGIPVLRLRSDAELDEHQRSLFHLADKDAVAIMPGAESGVIVSEKWAREYGLRGNDPSSSGIRRNKNRMAEALAVNEIPVCRQALHTCFSAAEAWATHVGYPVVVKPPESSGSDLVRICRNSVEFTHAAISILTNNTKYEVTSEGVLVQEFMEGDEYTLDGVVFDGKLIVFAVGKYTKIQIGGSFVYDCIEFFAPDDSIVDERIIAYAHDVVSALKVEVGPVHIEIILTAKGPLLVELAARPHGGIATAVLDASFEPKFTDAIIASYLGCDPRIFANITLQNHALIYFLKNNSSGTVKFVPGKKIVASLSSYVTSRWLVDGGTEVKETVDLSTCPALVHLANSDRSVLQADLDQIKSLDADCALIVLCEKKISS